MIDYEVSVPFPIGCCQLPICDILEEMRNQFMPAGQRSGRKQERPLCVFGRYLRGACRLKAQRLNISRYTWTRLAQESGIDRGVITDAVSGTSRPSVEKVWRLIQILEPPEELEKGICQSLRYCTEREYQLSKQAIDEVEANIDKELGSE